MTDDRLIRFERLSEVIRDLTYAVEVEPFLQKVVAAASELTDSEAASILELDEQGESLRFLAAPKVHKDALRAVRVPAERIPTLVDEVPLLAVVAASAEGTTRIEGLGELRHKESDRLDGTAAALSAMGGKVRVDGDALEVTGPTRLRGARIETLGDHRLAMAFAVAALAAQGETTLSDADCVKKSYPRFFADLDALR